MAKNSSWLLFSQSIQSFTSFLRSVILARSLGLDTYGSYALIVAFVGLIGEIFDLNVNAAVIKFGAEFRAKNQKEKLLALLKFSFMFSLFTAIASIIAVTIITTFTYNVFFQKEGLKTLIVIFAFGASFSFFDDLTKGILRLYSRFKANSILNIAMSFCELLIISISIIIYKNNLLYIIIAIVVARIINSAICNYSAFREIRDEIDGLWSANTNILNGEYKKRIISFILQNSVINTLQKIMKRGDVLLLGALTNTGTVAQYDVAKKLAFMTYTLKTPLSLSVYPQMAKLISTREYEALKKMLKTTFWITTIPLALMTLFAIIFSDWFLAIAYGDIYSDEQSRMVFSLLFVTVSLELIFFWTNSFMLSIGKVGLRLWINIIGLILQFSLAYFLIPLWGSAAMAFSLLLIALLSQIVVLKIANKELKLI